MRHTRKRAVLGGLVAGSVLAATAVGGWGVAMAVQSTGTPGAVGSSGPSPHATAPVPAGYSGLNDPALSACMRAREVCDPAKAAQLYSQSFAEPPSSSAVDISRSAAESIARGASEMLKPPGVTTPPEPPTFSAQMTGREFQASYGEQRSANVNEDRSVWIVTVYTDVKSEALVPTKVQHSYSAVIDAATGTLTDYCAGCAWLSSDG